MFYALLALPPDNLHLQYLSIVRQILGWIFVFFPFYDLPGLPPDKIFLEKSKNLHQKRGG